MLMIEMVELWPLW